MGKMPEVGFATVTGRLGNDVYVRSETGLGEESNIKLCEGS